MCSTTGMGCSCSRTIDIVEPDAADADDDTVDIDATDERCDIGGDPPPLRGCPCTEEAGEESDESWYCCRAGGAGGRTVAFTGAGAVLGVGRGAVRRTVVE